MKNVFGCRVINANKNGENEYSEILILPKSTYEMSKNPNNAWSMTEIVASWVEAQTANGKSSKDELPLNALQIYCTNHYINIALKYGHVEFVARTAKKMDQIWPLIRSCLFELNAVEYIAIFDALSQWAADHEKIVSTIRNFKKSNLELVHLLGLDARLAMENLTNPFNIIAADWIAKWPQISFVDDDTYFAIDSKPNIAMC